MSFVGSLFSDEKGAGYQAAGAPIQTPTTDQQAQAAYQQAQQALAQQQNFVHAVNAQTPQALATQKYLTNQLKTQAAGGGPNPAQAALNQNTGANVANQAALAAGQRGAASNVGLMQRQIAQQGAGIQQNAVGQEATLAAQQQLNAQNALQNLAGSQIGQVQNANTSQNNAVQGEQGALLSGIQGQNAANVSMTGNQNTANASIAQGNQAAQSGLTAGVAKGLGSMLMLSKGGQVQKFDDGGVVLNLNDTKPEYPSLGVDTTLPQATAIGPASNAGQLLQNTAPNVGGAGASGAGSPQNTGAGAIASQWAEAGFAPFKQAQDAQQNMAKTATSNPMGGGGGGGGGGGMGSMLPMLAMLSKGGNVGSKLKTGGKVPGNAKVSGDSVKNDNVKALLSPQEIVLPRSVTMAPDAPQKAAQFVAAVLAKQSMKRKK